MEAVLEYEFTTMVAEATCYRFESVFMSFNFDLLGRFSETIKICFYLTQISTAGLFKFNLFLKEI